MCTILRITLVACLVGLPAAAYADDEQTPAPEDPATAVANVMAGVAFATKCNTITLEEATKATQFAMVYGQRNGVDLNKSGEIARAAIATTGTLPEYTFTDSLCSLYATGVRNLITNFNK